MAHTIEIKKDVRGDDKAEITFEDGSVVLINITYEGDLIINSVNSHIDVKTSYPTSITLKVNK